MALVVLLFEASTPLLHLRKYLIQTNATHGALFPVVQAGFGLTFLLARIVVGYKECGSWAWRMWSIVAADGYDVVTDTHIQPRLVSVAIVLLALCVALSSLNAYWFGVMVTAALGLGGSSGGGKRGKAHQGDHSDVPTKLASSASVSGAPKGGSPLGGTEAKKTL